MSDIFREVDEEVRQEQIVTFLKRYGKYLAAALVVVILVVAGYRYLQDRRQAEHGRLGDTFDDAIALIDEGKATDATSKLQTIAKDSPADSYGLLARFRLAELQAKDPKAAQAIYDSIAADSSVARVYRDLAAYYAASLMLENGGSGAQLQKRLDGMSRKDNVWHLSVDELKGLNQYKMGQRDTAIKTFKDLLANAPADSGFKLRAGQMLQVLGVPTSEIATK